MRSCHLHTFAILCVIALLTSCSFGSIFNVAPSYPVGGHAPTAVVAGDFNRDGIPDVAVAANGGIYVLLGTAQGKLLPSVNYPTQHNPTGLALVDLNGDGNGDLVAIEGNDGVLEILLGDGTAAFHSTGVLNDTQGLPAAVTPGDFDHDGQIDLVVGSSAGLGLLKGNGDGSFQTVTIFDSSASVDVVAADLDQDGNLDVAAAFRPGHGMAVFLGNGDGTFQPGSLQKVSVPVKLAVSDLNLDGIPDLVAAVPSQGVSVMLGSGGGTFHSPHEYATPAFNTSSMQVADFDGDGTPDIVVTDGLDSINASNLTFLRNKGDGTFSTVSPSYGTGLGPISSAVADFNGDHRLDVVVANFDENTVSVMFGLPGGGFGAVLEANASNASITGAVGDFTGDGFPDLVTNPSRPGNGYLSVQSGNGDGTFAQKHFRARPGKGSQFGVGDFNHDGKLDLVALVPKEPAPLYTTYIGDGTGKLTRSSGGQGTRHTLNLFMADVNSDGNLDIVMSGLGATVSLGSGGAFGSGITSPVNGGTSDMAIADFDHDGRPDIVASSYHSTVFMTGNGDGTFQTAQFLAKATGSVTVGDFNGDGNLDAAIGGLDENGNSAVFILLGNGKGQFHAPQVNSIGYHADAIVSADFNNDSKADIAILDKTAHVVVALAGNGDGTFSSAQIFAVDIFPSHAWVSDVNNDGVPDLVVIGTSTFSVLLGNAN